MQRSKRKYKQTVLYFHHFAFGRTLNALVFFTVKDLKGTYSSTGNQVSEEFDLYFAIHKKSIVKC